MRDERPMDMNADIPSLLQRTSANSLLCIGTGEVPAVTRLGQTSPDIAITTLHYETPLDRSLGRFDLALAVDVVGRMSKSDGTRLIANLRNFHSNTVAVIMAAAEDSAQTAWSDTEFLALGLLPTRSGDGTRLYVYDIATYNDSRVWNSPRHWAHPENFRKFRW
jgi:hypothetical protein